MLSHSSLRDKLAMSSLIQRIATTALENTSDPAGGDESANSRIWSSPTRPPAWLHIFPEGQIYQHPNLQMRYFKWGVSRYILELPQPPIVLPMFFSGLQNVMHEKRNFPRFIPRAGNEVKITFGEAVPLERWDEVRGRWREIRASCAAIGGEEGERLLMEGKEAVRLRVEVTLMIRDEVEKLRVRCGYPPGEPEGALAETYKNQTNLHMYEVDPEKHVNS
ncbi:Tafazzin [Dactylella cylindrospora]|nr:Tafazzin [Dactylella cylindrospora]